MVMESTFYVDHLEAFWHQSTIACHLCRTLEARIELKAFAVLHIINFALHHLILVCWTVNAVLVLITAASAAHEHAPDISGPVIGVAEDGFRALRQHFCSLGESLRQGARRFRLILVLAEQISAALALLDCQACKQPKVPPFEAQVLTWWYVKGLMEKFCLMPY